MLLDCCSNNLCMGFCRVGPLSSLDYRYSITVGPSVG